MTADDLTLVGPAERSEQDAAGVPCPEPQVGARFVGETDPGAAEPGPLGLGATTTTTPTVKRAGAELSLGFPSGGLRISPRTWLASVLLALVMGAIVAIVLHLLGAEHSGRRPSTLSAVQARPKEPRQAPEPSRRGVPREPGEAGASVQSAPAQLDASALRELERSAALALRADDCERALPLYQKLERSGPQETWSFAVRLLQERCGDEQPARSFEQRAPLPPGQSSVEVGLDWTGAPSPEEVRLQLYLGKELREVLMIRDQARLVLPSRLPPGVALQGGTRLEVDCPPGYSTEQPVRRLPATLPEHLRLRVTCQRDESLTLLAVVRSGSADSELELSEVGSPQDGHPLLSTHGGVGHVLLSGPLGETLQLEGRPSSKGARLGESLLWVNFREREAFQVETIEVKPPKVSSQRRAAPAPTRIPYRL